MRIIYTKYISISNFDFYVFTVPVPHFQTTNND